MNPASWAPAVIGLLLLAGPEDRARNAPASPEAPGGAEASRTPEEPGVLVDLGIQKIDLLRVQSVAHRMEKDWWAVVMASYRDRRPGDELPFRVLRSADAGRTWREDPERTAALDPVAAKADSNLDFFTWYTPDVGVLAGGVSSKVLRTVDAGRTWQPVALAEKLRVYTWEHVGGRTWLCGSSGNLHRSDDAGASWRMLRNSPFTEFDNCASLSFLDAERGWALSKEGRVWETSDGGEHWRPLKAPPWSGKPEQVVRLTPKVGWLGGAHADRFKTLDGGKTWHAQPLSPEQMDADPRLARTPAGQPVITLGATSGAPETWVPAMREYTVPMGKDTVVVLEGRYLRAYVSGRLRWAGPLRSAGTGVLTPLEGMARKSPEEWLGWTGEHAVATFDAGRNWVPVGRFPKTPVRRLLFLEGDKVLARAADGTLMRSTSHEFGSDWRTTTDAMDAFDFARRTRLASDTSPASAPFECVLAAAPASLKVQFDQLGCFHFIKNSLSLEFTQQGVRLSGVLTNGEEDSQRIEPRVLSRAEAERIVQSLAKATTGEEQKPGCGSTSSLEAAIEWTCPASAETYGKLELSADDCRSDDNEPSRARAALVHQVAKQVLKDASR
ncbi:hypothetical protein HPC49_39015 [Pyxidicoccus fallax]|uniref:Photosynthesis system II assembly factor Ycf48/Hcf136-like domain-containing protein n=1 Tax=Pyxidicoccus fallax TaxID=394095 RepID=A0A848LQ25_9BACT|nr:hypothetical protein [Pyxidicoccus fallax]NMO19801.1 hypothetical protein [Pyxidicoccus fallax]NPC84191.1 hypothetical protein [Pyxidicoccus fallax]